MVSYQEIDYVAAKHFVMYGNKLDAYTFSRTGITTSTNKQSLKNMAWKYFAQDHIKRLVKIETQRFIDDIPVMFERLEVKDLMPAINNNNNKQPDFNPNELDKLDKEGAKKVLIKLINTNKTDAKTVSQAMQLLSKLEQWDKEKITQDSNIVFYELPKKVN